MKRVLLALSLAGLCVALTGCSQSQDYPGAQRYPLTGTVTVDGEPIEIGNISLLPAAGSQAQRGTGEVIKDGKYEFPEGRGPDEGDYKVVVKWTKPTGREVRQEDGTVGAEYKEGLPAKYSNPNQTELSITIPAEKNVHNFELTTK